jgi:hypothetical protein
MLHTRAEAVASLEQIKNSQFRPTQIGDGKSLTWMAAETFMMFILTQKAVPIILRNVFLIPYNRHNCNRALLKQKYNFKNSCASTSDDNIVPACKNYSVLKRSSV